MLNFGSGSVSVLKVMIEIEIPPGASIIRALNPSEMKTHQEKSSEVIIPVLEHGKLHVGSGRVSMLKIMIKIIGPSLGP